MQTVDLSKSTNLTEVTVCKLLLLQFACAQQMGFCKIRKIRNLQTLRFTIPSSRVQTRYTVDWNSPFPLLPCHDSTGVPPLTTFPWGRSTGALDRIVAVRTRRLLV